MTVEIERPADEQLVEVAPHDGRRKVREWPVPDSTAPVFVAAFLEAPRTRQQALHGQAVAQANRDAYDLGYTEGHHEPAEPVEAEGDDTDHAVGASPDAAAVDDAR